MKHIQKESHSLTCIPCRGAVSEGSLVHSHEFGTFIRRKSPLGSSKINHWSGWRTSTVSRNGVEKRQFC